MGGRHPPERPAGMDRNRRPTWAGIRIEIDRIEERRPKGKEAQYVRWTVKPQTCSINWDWIITVQVAGENAANLKEIGFTRHSARS